MGMLEDFEARRATAPGSLLQEEADAPVVPEKPQGLSYLERMEAQRKKRSEERTIIDLNQSVAPAAARKAKDLSSKTGLPEDLVSANPDEAQRSLNVDNIDKATDKKPASRALVLDPQIGPAIQDDLHAITGLETLLTDLADFLRPILKPVGIPVRATARSLARTSAGVRAGISQYQAFDQATLATDSNRSFIEIFEDEKTQSLFVGRAGAAEQQLVVPLNLLFAAGRFIRSRVQDPDDALANALFFQHEAKALRDERASIPQTPTTKAFAAGVHKSFKIHGTTGMLRFIATNPGGALSFAGETLAEFIPFLIGATVATRVAGPQAGSAVLGLSSFNIERFAAFGEALEKSGVDMTDPAQVKAALQNPALIKRLKDNTELGSAVVGVLDMMAAGLASQTFGGPIRTFFGQTITQMTLGATGEAGKSVVIEGKVDIPAAALEAVGELGTGPAEVASVTSKVATGKFRKLKAEKIAAARAAVFKDKLVEIASIIETSKVNAENPELFQQLFDRLLEHSEVEDVKVNAAGLEATLAAAGDENMTAAAFFEAAGIDPVIVERAARMGLDVTIKIPDFFKALKEEQIRDSVLLHVRESDLSPTIAETEVSGADFEQRVADAIKALEKEVRSKEDKRLDTAEQGMADAQAALDAAETKQAEAKKALDKQSQEGDLPSLTPFFEAHDAAKSAAADAQSALDTAAEAFRAEQGMADAQAALDAAETKQAEAKKALDKEFLSISAQEGKETLDLPSLKPFFEAHDAAKAEVADAQAALDTAQESAPTADVVLDVVEQAKKDAAQVGKMISDAIKASGGSSATPANANNMGAMWEATFLTEAIDRFNDPKSDIPLDIVSFFEGHKLTVTSEAAAGQTALSQVDTFLQETDNVIDLAAKRLEKGEQITIEDVKPFMAELEKVAEILKTGDLLNDPFVARAMGELDRIQALFMEDNDLSADEVAKIVATQLVNLREVLTSGQPFPANDLFQQPPKDTDVYHVTFEENVDGIRESGLKPLQPSNFVVADGTRANKQGGVFVFESPHDAVGWAKRMEFDFPDQRISILRVRRTETMEADPSLDPNIQSGQGQALQSLSGIAPADIVGVTSVSDLDTPLALGLTWAEFQDQAASDIAAGPTVLFQPGTPAFEAWFRDSKVVDENGDPLVVYHGTSKLVESFAGGHLYFTDDPDNASGFAQSSAVIDEEGAAVVQPTYLSFQNPLIIDAPDFTSWEGIPFEDQEWEMNSLAMMAEGRGHDGLIVRNVVDSSSLDAGFPQTTYVAFYTGTVKSTLNRGAFSFVDPDILNQGAALLDSVTLDPLEAEGAWRDIILPAQQEDGTVEQVSAGDMADAIDRRQKAAERLLDCVKN